MSEGDAPIRLVIADDHAVVRLGLRALVGNAPDMELVGEAEDGAELLRLCTSVQPDVVLMDLSMAGMDGLEATRRLVRRPDPPKVLALTMHEEEEYLIPALEAGASGYIVKAAASSELLEAVRAVASGQTWVRPTAAHVLARGWVRRSAQSDLRTGYDSLSDREREVFRLTAQGHPASRIGELLHLSPKTVDTYRRRINDKLRISDRSDYVRIALELGVLSADP
ncbi:MAG: response regulator transcription factor [Myxococcota bacterium]